MISLGVWIQYISVTDRETDTGRRLLPRLRTASRGKKSQGSIAMVDLRTEVFSKSILKQNFRNSILFSHPTCAVRMHAAA